MNIGNVSSNSAIYTNPQLTEAKGEKPEGFQGSSRDAYVRDDSKEFAAEQAFADAGKIFQSRRHKGPNKSRGPQQGGGAGRVGDEITSSYPNRNGYDKSFLGKELPLPTLGASIKEHVAMRTDKPGEAELTYTNFSVVMNKDRRQCFYAAVNIDGNQSQNLKREGDWTIDSRIPREYQLGNEAYIDNDIDKGHMVRRLDPCWGSSARQAGLDTFTYCNATLQHANLNQKEWLELENHVLDSASGQKMTVMQGPIFSDNDPKFDNHGKMDKPTQIPMKFWKTVVWNDQKSGELKSASFVLSQEDIIHRDGGLFKGGFEPGRFNVYQVPQSQLEQMTDLHFGNIGDITSSAVQLTAANNFTPQGL